MKIPFTSNIGTKLMALVLGILLWGYSYMQNLTDKTIACTVSFRTPTDYAVNRPQDARTTIDITVRGPRHILENLPERMNIGKEIDPVSLEGTEPTKVVQVAITAQDMSSDERLTFRELPRYLDVEVLQQATKTLPVTVIFKGRPTAGYVRSEEKTLVSPRSVQVTGPRTVLDKVETIYTRDNEVNITGLWAPETFRSVPIDPMINGVPVKVEPNRVEVKVDFDRKVTTRTVEPVQVRYMAPSGYPYQVTLEPQTVSITIEGTEQAMAALKPEDVRALVTLSLDDKPRDPPNPYIRRLEAKVQAGLTAISITPADINVWVTAQQP